MLDDPEVKTDKLVKAIQVDPALSAQLLRVANSAFFSRRTKVSSIDRVIITLGMGGIRQFVMASAVLEKFQGAKIEAAKQIWKHSILAGNWAQALARARGLRLPEQEVFVAGMLHDAGRLVIIQYFPDVKQAVAELCASGMVRVQAERETVGVTHADIGAYLFNFWQFPETLIESSRHHHDPPAMIGPSELGPIPRLVNAACRIARTLRADALEESLAELDDEFRDCHEVTGEMLLDLFPEVLRESEQTDWLR
jgi:HD-like signal output (HDOD) protein